MDNAFFPVLLAANHQLDDFACDVDSLDDWLKRRAHPNQLSGASRTYVVLEGKKVIGYYCLASGALELNDAPASASRNMPDPVAILGRLAVDKSWQGRGLGVALLQDAVGRTVQAGGILGIRGLLVHALSIEAEAFMSIMGLSHRRHKP